MAATTAKVSELSALQAQVEVRSLSRPMASVRRQSVGPSAPLTRVSPSLPKNGGRWALCQHAHPIGTWYPQDWYSCDNCPPSARRLPFVWHLDSSAGILRPPGWSAPQVSRKRRSPLCSLFSRVKKFCFPSPPQMVLSEVQDDEDDEEHVNMRALDPLTASIEQETSDAPPSTSSRANLVKTTDGISVKLLEDQLTRFRMREVDNLATREDMRQQIVDLKALNHDYRNQLNLQADEINRVRKDLETAVKNHEELDDSLRLEKQKFIHMESELRAECEKESLKCSKVIQDLRSAMTQQLEIKVCRKRRTSIQLPAPPAKRIRYLSVQHGAHENQGVTAENEAGRDANVDPAENTAFHMPNFDDPDAPANEENEDERRAASPPPTNGAAPIPVAIMVAPQPVQIVQAQPPVAVTVPQQLPVPQATAAIAAPLPLPFPWGEGAAVLVGPPRARVSIRELDKMAARSTATIPHRIIEQLGMGMTRSEFVEHLVVLRVTLTGHLERHKKLSDQTDKISRWISAITSLLKKTEGKTTPVDMHRVMTLMAKIRYFFE